MKINDKFEAVRDRDGWTLLESYTGTGKDGNPKVLQRKTYHANLRQVIDKVIDLDAASQPDLDAVMARVESLRNEIVERLEKR